jgi:hypothetical protein
MGKFLHKIKDTALCGAILELNLVQCQALNKLHSKIATKYENIIEVHKNYKDNRFSKHPVEIELDTELLTLLSEVNAFLGLFKDFIHPDTVKGLWMNEDDKIDLEEVLGPNKAPVDYDVSDLNKRIDVEIVPLGNVNMANFKGE